MELNITALRERARRHVESGDFAAELATMVGYRTVSSDPEQAQAVRAYLDEILRPALDGLGCVVEVHENPSPLGGPIIVGRRVESPELPTVLCYGHADVVTGQEGLWRDGLDPWALTIEGEHWYGRGSADNKGQHHQHHSSALPAVGARLARLQPDLSDRVQRGDRLTWTGRVRRRTP
jgi:acetylornithine deacetylase/succinyl-diaminopimelate desuccinylase-like protein